MKLGIDTFGCNHARSGVGTYLLSFTSNIPDSIGIETELFGPELDRYTYTSGKDIAFQSADVPDNLSAERFWHFTNINKFIQNRKYDAVIYPAPENVLPISFKVPGIAVVNSILSAQVEGNTDWIQKLQIKRGLYKIQKIIAASQFIMDDLTSHGIEAEKIEVIYNGIDHKLFYPARNLITEFIDIKPFSIKRPYFIYSSRLSGAEKKHIELIKAFTLFKERTGFPHRLVLAGSSGPYSAEIHNAALNSSVTSDIFITGHFPHESLPKLYAGSEACIFPGVNEGSGLPLLEAMASAVPVLCSNTGALPEIGGNAALYFDSDNIEEIAAALEKIVCDKELYDSMVSAGIEQAKRFNWKTTVEQTYAAVKKVIEESI